MPEYTPPQLGATAFHCPFCGVYAEQIWHNPITGAWFPPSGQQQQKPFDNIHLVVCRSCDKFSVWIDTVLTYPTENVAPPPSPDMPSDVARDYEEARKVFSVSPKASAALLRLAIQRLCVHLGGSGKDINTDIGSLVTKGLPTKIQKALDTVRVIGNESVHPGTIDVNDKPEIASALFRIVNMIIYEMITKEKELDEIYSSLPTSNLDGIARRDGVTVTL